MEQAKIEERERKRQEARVAALAKAVKSTGTTSSESPEAPTPKVRGGGCRLAGARRLLRRRGVTQRLFTPPAVNRSSPARAAPQARRRLETAKAGVCGRAARVRVGSGTVR